MHKYLLRGLSLRGDIERDRDAVDGREIPCCSMLTLSKPKQGRGLGQADKP